MPNYSHFRLKHISLLQVSGVCCMTIYSNVDLPHEACTFNKCRVLDKAIGSRVPLQIALLSVSSRLRVSFMPVSNTRFDYSIIHSFCTFNVFLHAAHHFRLFIDTFKLYGSQ
jgi:hypothetical protein